MSQQAGRAAQTRLQHPRLLQPGVPVNSQQSPEPGHSFGPVTSGGIWDTTSKLRKNWTSDMISTPM